MSGSGVPAHGLTRLCLRLVPFAWRRRGPGAFLVVMLLVDVAISLIKPWPLKVLVDNVLQHHPLSGAAGAVVAGLPGEPAGRTLLPWVVGATVVVFLLGWAAALGNAYASALFGQRLTYDVATAQFSHLQTLSLRYHARQGSGNLIRRVTADSECVSAIVQSALIPAVTALVSIVGMLAVMVELNVGLTLLALATIPVMALTLRRYAGPMADRSYALQQAEGTMYDTLEQTLTGLPVVQAFGAERRTDARFRQDTDRVLSRTVSQTATQFRFKILIGTAMAVGTAAVYWLAGHEGLSGHLTVGDMLVFVSYMGSLYGPLSDLMYTSSTVSDAAGSARRVLEVLDAPAEVEERPGAPALVAVRGHVRIEEVTFGYEPDRPVLHGVSLEGRPGETVAIVGATGAGKSTLVSLIPRFFDPDSGRVLIDGHDVRGVQLAGLRRAVALVLQESFLFPTTIFENIAYGRPDATRQEVIAAARAANAHEFISRLPRRYRTQVGERGATLSGGERQRIAIARALLKDAPILILDEPTSAVDAHTEHLLLDALDRLMAGRTTFIIAHRLSTVRAADRIVVLDGGRIVEGGSHHELMALEGAYRRLHDIQSGALRPAPVAVS